MQKLSISLKRISLWFFILMIASVMISCGSDPQPSPQPSTVTITFDANGGEGTMAAQKVNKNTSTAISANVFTRTGYIFDGWATEKTGAVVYTDKQSVAFETDVTLYAHWTAYTYKVKFNANGGTGDQMADQDFVYGTAQKLSKNTYTKDNYTFAGWATSETGNPAYEDEKSVINLTAEDGATVNLYARWAGESYTVTFDANGGTGAIPASKEVNFGLTYGDLATTSREGYTFNGWFTASTEGTKITPETEVTLTTNQTLYAQWTPTYSVTFNGNGGTGSMDPQIFYGVETQLSANEFEKEGYVFSGWNTEDDGSGTQYAEEESINPSENMVLYAQWIIPLTIKANANGVVVTFTNYETADDNPKLMYTKTGESPVSTPTEVNGNITINNGEELSLYWARTSEPTDYFNIRCSGECDVYGNVMSLYLYLDKTTLPAYAFAELFSADSDSEITNANELILPATTLTSHCYDSMFSYCYSLITVPELPATTLAEECYRQMFKGTGITTTPVLHVENVTAAGCYEGMFAACGSLNTVICLAKGSNMISYCSGWLIDVNPGGTFYRNAAATTGPGTSKTWTTNSEDGIPSGWTDVEYSPSI